MALLVTQTSDCVTELNRIATRHGKRSETRHRFTDPQTHGLAEFERELIRARTGEGLKRARERGIRSGPKPKLTPHQQREALAQREAGESCAEIGRSYNVSHSTISRLKA